MANRAFTDPFEVLGLPPSASKADVKTAFRRLALRCHPDVDASPQAAARFREIKHAADAILKGHHSVGLPGPGPSSAYAAWQAYSAAAAAAAGARHAPDPHDWRPRSPRTAVGLCGVALVAGFGIFYGALLSHEWLDGYRWLTPAVADDRLRHPTPRRQQLQQLMIQQRGEQQQRAAAAGVGVAQGEPGARSAAGALAAARPAGAAGPAAD